MDVMELLSQMGGVQSVAQELGISEKQASNGAAALLPAILGGFKKQTSAQPSGLAGLGGLLGQLGGSGLLDSVLSAKPTNVSQGNNVLGQIFGSKDVSRAVASSAASQSGLDAGVLKKMLPMLAMMVTGFMSKAGDAPQQAQAPSAGGGLGKLLGGLVGGLTGGGRAPGAAPSSGLGALLDMDGDGNPLDDILNMAGKMLG